MFFVLLEIDIPLCYLSMVYYFFSFPDFLLRGACLLNVEISKNQKTIQSVCQQYNYHMKKSSFFTKINKKFSALKFFASLTTVLWSIGLVFEGR